MVASMTRATHTSMYASTIPGLRNFYPPTFEREVVGLARGEGQARELPDDLGGRRRFCEKCLDGGPAEGDREPHSRIALQGDDYARPRRHGVDHPRQPRCDNLRPSLLRSGV